MNFFGEIKSLLEEKGTETISRLEKEMKAAAAEMNFEKAARIRDGLHALMIMQNQNIVETFDTADRDYIAYHREGELVSFTVLKIRAGKLLGRDNYRVTSLNDDEGLLSEFMGAYYTSKEDLPPNIYVPTKSGLDYLQKWINDSLNALSNIVLISDNIENASRHKAAMNMAFQNAKEDIIRRMRERGDIPALKELQSLLGLKSLPIRIEGFDIAHIGGKFPVASLISFYNGNPDKKNYRYFRLKTTEGVIDDFQSMREATSRRYTRLLNEQADLPDLILIDGGIGQVNAVQGILKSLSLDIPIAGLAKRDEEIWLPNAEKPICLPKRSDALRLLQRVRDETHRFATSRNQRLRTKENTVSLFTELPEVGEKRARLLAKQFTTIATLASSNAAAISDTLKIPIEKAEKILAEAKELSEIRTAKKEVQMQSLKSAGTTWQSAAATQHIEDLADAALDD